MANVRKGNSNLHDSARNKQDEFYTNLDLIEDELKHYRAHFKGKRILCNCDDPYESNFFKYFATHFNLLGIKSLTATCYAYSCIAGKEIDMFTPRTKKPHKIVITEVGDVNGDGRIDLADVEWLIKNDKNVLTELNGDGDFRSPECVELLDEADIVVTNPPFSLFREYIALLMEHKKDFLIVGNMNNCAYKEMLPLIMQNRVWLGYSAGHFWFKVPSSYEEKATDFKIDAEGQKWRRMGNICWFTNLDIEKRHEDMVLFRHYSPDEYPRYDNYDAIDVSRTADIPCDYYGIMGVPITFMAKHNPAQFEVLGSTRYHDGQPFADDINFINGKGKFTRMLIRRREGAKK